ncbi:MAG: hypothetical protein ACC645_06615, partial [Pirellulales bacterium]
ADASYVALVEREPHERSWGTYLFRVSGARPYVVHVPRPLYEQNAFEVGCSMFEQIEASALLIAGAHPYANRDGSSNIMRFVNRTNALNVVHQAMIRESGSEPMIVVQIRAIRAPVDADIVVNSSAGMVTSEQGSPLFEQLLERLESDGLRTRMVDGSHGTAGYEAGLPAPTCQVDQGENKEVVALWVSPALRGKYRNQESNRLLAAACDAADIPLESGDLYSHLARVGTDAAASDLPPALREALLAYLDNLDVVQLCTLKARWLDCRFTSLLDVTSGQQFLLIARANGKVSDVVNVSGWIGHADRSTVMERLGPKEIAQFVRSRATWLRIRACSKTTRAAASHGRKTGRQNEVEEPGPRRSTFAVTTVSVTTESQDASR